MYQVYVTNPVVIGVDISRSKKYRQTDKVKPLYPPFNFVEAVRYNKSEFWVMRQTKANKKI